MQSPSNNFRAGLDPDYDRMTDDEFDHILNEILDDSPPSHWCYVYPEVYSILKEGLNNEVLEKWAERNPHLLARPDGVIQCLPYPYMEEWRCHSSTRQSSLFLQGDIIVVNIEDEEKIAIVLNAHAGSDSREEIRTDLDICEEVRSHTAGMICYSDIVRYATWDDIEAHSGHNESPEAIAMGLPRLPSRPE
jgi:hypothetical protein